MVFPDLRLCLLFTPALCRRDPWLTLDAALCCGVDLVQWRVKHADPDGLHECLRRCRAAAVPVIVNDDVRLAVQTSADGAHVGQDDMPAEQARRLLGARWLGVSTHDTAQIRAAARADADYLGFGPCFPTTTKGYATGQPQTAVTDAVRAASDCSLPLFAIGGITPANLPQLQDLGVRRIAVSAAILQADDAAGAARRLRALLR
jgi:thiamine-phosphate pyrophosphorylase